MTNTCPYRVDGEIGRLTFPTHQVVSDDLILYDTAQDVFPGCRYWEQYKTTGFKELSFIYGTTELSYHKTVRLINRVRYQPKATPATTLRDGVRQEGTRVLATLEKKTTAILKQEGFTAEGQPLTSSAIIQQTPMIMPSEEVSRAIAACGLSADEQAEVERNPVLYEQASHSVNISLDDVVVKKQKADRERRTVSKDERDEGESQSSSCASDSRKYVHNTVAHIQQNEQSYTLNGQSVPGVLRVILGFLLRNALLGYRLQWFVDGQQTLQSAILSAFSWVTNLGLLLDWYHLKDKCKRQLSLAIKGTARRNEVLSDLTRLLWYGMTDSAITYLQKLPDEDLKNPDAIRIMIGYIERNRPYIPCYEVRKQLGLRNSSQIGEKMNDVLVSDRQKHNGMSWTPTGSATLAALKALKQNGEDQLWFEYADMSLQWAA